MAGNTIVKIKSTPSVVKRIHRGAPGAPGVAGGYNSPAPVTIIDGTSYIIPAGKQLQSIAIIPEAGTRVISVGYTAGAGEVIDAEEVADLDGVCFPIGRYFHTTQTIHFSGFIGSVLIYIL